MYRDSYSPKFLDFHTATVTPLMTILQFLCEGDVTTSQHAGQYVQLTQAWQQTRGAEVGGRQKGVRQV